MENNKKVWVTPKADYVMTAEHYKAGHAEGEYKLKYLTIGKAYEIVRIDGGDNIYIIADDGRERPHAFRMFDVVDESWMGYQFTENK